MAFERDRPKFESRNAQVVGISTDLPATQKAWAKERDLQYPLVADWDFKAGKGHHVSRAYGILETNPQSLFFNYTKEAYLIIDKNGIVRYKKTFESLLTEVDIDKMNEELLAELDKLK
jgi:peroxiredoxin